MKKLLIGLTLISLLSTSAHASSSYCKYDENNPLAVGTRFTDQNDVTVIESYEGNMIHGLKKGEKTFIIYVQNPSTNTQGEFYFANRDEGLFPEATLYLVTQSEEVKDRILNSPSLCSYGSKIIRSKDIRFNGDDIHSIIRTGEEDFVGYQVVTNIVPLRCNMPLAYSDWTLENYSIKKRPELMGDKIFANCRF